MKKLIYLLMSLLIVGCSSDKNGPVDADPYPAQIAIKVVVSERKASDLNSTVLEVPSGQFIITFSC